MLFLNAMEESFFNALNFLLNEGGYCSKIWALSILIVSFYRGDLIQKQIKELC